MNGFDSRHVQRKKSSQNGNKRNSQITSTTTTTNIYLRQRDAIGATRVADQLHQIKRSAQTRIHEVAGKRTQPELEETIVQVAVVAARSHNNRKKDRKIKVMLKNANRRRKSLQRRTQGILRVPGSTSAHCCCSQPKAQSHRRR